MPEEREGIQRNEVGAPDLNLKTYDRSASGAAPCVSVVILNYKNWAMTERCLARLFEIDYPNYRVVVVDNGSEQPCPDWMPAYSPKTEFLFNSRNLGYAEGCNRGIRHARQFNPDYIWLLNNDTEVDAGSLKSMTRLFESNPELGAVGSVLRNPGIEGRVQSWGGGRISFFSGLPKHFRRESNSGFDYICGASLLLRVAALDQVGLLDPRFFLYWEDADICLRLRAAGWRLGVANSSMVVHRGSATTLFQSVSYDYHFTLSSVRFYRRHCRNWWLPVFVSLIGRMTKRALSGRTRNSMAVLAGFRDAFGNTCHSDFDGWNQ